ncbi:hypothetical protein EVC02_007 [Rhizobium phage RHph_N17]|nr:hypothetical protein EVC02_007 [Rhizobium phage RHph_N17]
MAKLSVAKAEAALRAHHGILLKAAEACGVSRMTFYKFMKQHPHLEEVRAECDEILLDVGEAAVVKVITADEPDMKTVRWHLERKGKDRGYTTRQESTGKDGEPLQMGVIERRIVDPEGEEE